MSSFEVALTLINYKLTSRILLRAFCSPSGQRECGGVKWAEEYFHIHMNVKVVLNMFLHSHNDNSKNGTK